jgi:cytidylate kinase
MTIVDEIEELRAELRHCCLTARERREAQAKLTDLIRKRDEHDATQDMHD